MIKRINKKIRYACFGLMALTTCDAQAVDFLMSGFGTVGFAKSNQAEPYQRHINSTGNFRRDTVLGGQLNAAFNNEWGATVQAKLMSHPTLDKSMQAVVSWAFLSYRPTNDMLFRLGKLRIPFYLNSENADVGTTFVGARLPMELYNTAAVTDFQGIAFSKTWPLGENDLTLDGYWGKANAAWRFYARDPNNMLTTTGASGEFFAPLAITSQGVRLSLQQEDNTFQAGIHYATSTPRTGTLGPSTFLAAPAAGCAPVNIPPAFIGNYYCPAANVLDKITSQTINVGMNVDLGNGFRTIDEYVRTRNLESQLGLSSDSFYLTLLKQIDSWTPYISYAQVKTQNRGLYQAVNNAQTIVPVINAYQRMLADVIAIYDQHTWSLGTAYTIDSKSKLKAEWAVTQTGVASNFVYAPPGGESGNKRISIMSFSYNFVF